MPVFVYYKAQNKLGYAVAIHYTEPVYMTKESTVPNIFQRHRITDSEAVLGFDYLIQKYKVRVRVKARTQHV